MALEDSYKNRVTLFKACYNPIKGKRSLKFYARSGTSYQRVKVRFTIDDGSVEKNEGVASRAYFMNSIAGELDLPEWPNSANHGDAACKEYCERSHITWETANQLSVKSRSIAAVVVRSKAGQRWGVLVLDSRDPKGVSLGGPVGGHKKAMMNLVAQVLTNHV